MGKDIGLFLARVCVFVLVLLCLVLIHGNATEVDILCLKTLKRNFKDPHNYLSTWKFENGSEGYICNFLGVDCWHPDENRVLNIKLPGMGLEGDFPMGFNYCTTMTGLDLSDNKFSGIIPAKLSKWLQYLTSLDLSQNHFVGPIPREFANLTYLNILHLESNQLTGQIPWELSRLERLKDFNVANNRLSGQIPTFLQKVEAANFNNNSGLCGLPLRNCNETLPAKKTSPVIATAASVTGVSVVFLLVFALWWFFVRSVPKEIIDTDESKWAKRIKGRSTQVSMFEKPISKIRLADLIVATNEFSTENIIGTGRTGTMYKATLPDGSLLAIKRLRPSAQTDKQFKSEMNTLGHLRHRNLVPLLGYCVAKGEKLLVYGHMPNGALCEQLHAVKTEVNTMDWPKRLKIAIGAARGLAWLHHSCNPRIIHRNVSSNCILLNEDYEPRITDFGLARLMNPVDTHLSTFVNGDFGDLGYVAPEYMRTLVATLKGDVFSFGVVLLELVTGQKPIEVENVQESFKGNLVDWISHLSKHSIVQEAIDNSLIGRGHDEEILQVLKVACNCVLPPHKERPSMYEVYQLRLEGLMCRYFILKLLMDPLLLQVAHPMAPLMLALEGRRTLILLLIVLMQASEHFLWWQMLLLLTLLMSTFVLLKLSFMLTVLTRASELFLWCHRLLILSSPLSLLFINIFFSFHWVFVFGVNTFDWCSAYRHRGFTS